MQFNVEDELAIDASSEFSFSTEDLEQIDLWSAANVNHSIPTIQGSDGPLVSVERDEVPHKCEEATSSPYSSFREKQGSLSVSDIASPAWCEVQFAYGLQQFRTLPIEERPAAFVTPAGNEIKVLQRVAERNDKAMKAGTAIHKKLEVELYQEAVLVETESDEERWALRLLDFLVRLQPLQHDGICRELQVAGIIEDQLVTGIVDEIRVARTTAKLPTAMQMRSESSSSKRNQRSLDSYFSRADGTNQSHPSVTLEIIDNKTRYNRTVPHHIDTLPSRLQLMLYHRLVSAMLDRETTHFIDVWRRKQLNPAKPFSENFKKELNVIAVDNDLSLLFLDVNCLEDMLLPYHDTIDLLGINREPSKWLFLVYRARDEQNPQTHGEAGRKKRKWSKYDKRSRRKKLRIDGVRADHTVVDDESEESTISEGRDIAVYPPTAPHAEVVEDVAIIERTPASASSPKDAMNPSTTDRAHTSHTHANVEALIAYSDSSSNSESETSIRPSESHLPSPTQSGIIGTKKFQYNESFLRAHFTSIMEWWRGKRLAKGVEIEQTYRCNSCEYSEGCEWRAMKAEEFAQKKVARRTISTDSKDAHNS